MSLSPEDEYIVSIVSQEMLVSFIRRCEDEPLLVGLEKPLTSPGVEYTASYMIVSQLALVAVFCDDFIDMGFLE